MSRKTLSFLPQTVTFAGILMGICSMVWAPHRPYAASVAILLACTCDLLDGMVARLTGTESAFGAQLDSFADAINCGVAPAFLLYHWSLHGWEIAGFDLYLLVCFGFVACATTRLSRFNLSVSQAPEVPVADAPDAAPRIPMFSGIAAPVAAMLACTLVMTHHELGLGFLRGRGFLVTYVVAVAYLMVSTIPFRSFKRFRTRWGQKLFFGSILGGYLTLALGGPGGLVLQVILLLYVATGLVQWLLGIDASAPSKSRTTG